MRILFITATRLGDAVLSTGLLSHLLRTHPKARITIAAGPIAAPLFARLPNLDRIITVEKRRFDAHWLTLWLATVTTRWDLAVDLRGSALTLLIPARRRAIMRGGRRPGPRLAHLAGTLNLAPPPLPTTWTAPEDRARAAALLPPDKPLAPPPSDPAFGSPAFIEPAVIGPTLIGPAFIGPTVIEPAVIGPAVIGPAFIGLGPTANWPGKIWPPDRFAALYTALAATIPNARPVIFGGPGPQEAALAAPLLAALPNAIDLTGKLTLPEAAACLARCALFIGNDSGLMHLAAAAGAPTLGLFGPTPASEYAPAGPQAAAVLAEGTRMETLSVAKALHAAKSLLSHANKFYVSEENTPGNSMNSS